MAEDRIGLMARSLGSVVAIYTAGIDKRPAAVISSVGWGNGEKKFQVQHATPRAWRKFTDMLAVSAIHKK